MSDNNINNMDIKQLRNEVQLLRDELAIMKRNFEDILYNLDTDNFSQRIVKQGEDMYTKIEQTADKIELQAEKVEENEKSIASLEITADEIQSEVFEEIEDGTKVSRITQNANAITAEVTARKNAISDLNSEFTLTADGITTAVSRKMAVKFKKNVKPTASNTSDEEKGMLCEYDNTLYYYNDISGTWKLYPLDGVRSQFIQTADGFEFTNDVKINADLIVKGTISADRIDTDNLSCTRLYAKGNTTGYSVRLNGSLGDFGIFNGSASDYASANGYNCMFGIYNSFPNVNLFIYGNNFMGYDVDTDTIWAKGNWDFSVANVKGL